jgi:ABC-2 type transport system ATP-binding protein
MKGSPGPTGSSDGGLAVEAQGLGRSFGRVVAVERIDLEIRRGEFFGLLGPNGAGKTTTLRMLCGLLPPSTGSARVAGVDVWREPMRARTRLGYLDEEPIVYPYLTGREFLELVADLYGVARGGQREGQIQRLFSLFEIGDKADELISSYSHGTRQKVGLASLLIHDPQVLFLDEPTNGLDPRATRRVKELLQELAERGRAVILSTHILEIAQALCHRVAIIHAGRVAAVGTLEELRAGAGAGADGASLEDLFLQLTGGPEQRDVIERLLQR